MEGLNEFYLIESQKPEDDEAILHRIRSSFLSNSFVVRSISDEIIHILSHRKIHAFFIHLEVDGNDFESLQKHQKLRASSAAEIEKLPKPVLIDNYLNHIIF